MSIELTVENKIKPINEMRYVRTALLSAVAMFGFENVADMDGSRALSTATCMNFGASTMRAAAANEPVDAASCKKTTKYKLVRWYAVARMPNRAMAAPARSTLGIERLLISQKARNDGSLVIAATTATIAPSKFMPRRTATIPTIPALRETRKATAINCSKAYEVEMRLYVPISSLPRSAAPTTVKMASGKSDHV